VSAGPILFWLATAVLAWVYAGYPLAAAVIGRLRPLGRLPNAVARPLVTVGIAAHDEADQLEARIDDVLAQTGSFDLEVVVASDGSRDASTTVLERIASREPRLRWLDLERVGQTAAQAEIFRVARGDIVVLSDAETRFAPDCLARLVAPFGDSSIGCTTGRLEWLGASATQTSQNEGAYWRYEQRVRTLESRAGWLTAVTGALLAVRRSCYRAVPAHASMDHLLPLYVREQGLRVIAIPAAVGFDRPISGLRDQFQNRGRTATRGIRANLSMAGRLAPWRHPTAALSIWSHKLLRWATPFLGIASLGGAALAVRSGQLGYALPIVAAGLGLALAIIGWVARQRRISPPRLAAFALAIVVVNLAFLAGWWNVARGRRIEAWHRETWDIGAPARGHSGR
jgi:cellulose synthase/poly-beta-1,6-N-acetylglucosamine synthase-like glycosyltransferase